QNAVKHFFFFLLLFEYIDMKRSVPDKIPLIEAELGQTVNLTCDTSGHDNGELNKEDEATYLCQTGAAYNLAFVYGTNLIKSYRVNQTSDMKSILLGTSVTLQCSLHPEKKKKGSTDQCADEHDVFWFRAESESNPGFIYADKKHCSKQAGRSCEYRLPKTIQNSSDAGTYYCAVVTCGEILFGEGTKVETSKFLGTSLSFFLPLQLIYIQLTGHLKTMKTQTSSSKTALQLPGTGCENGSCLGKRARLVTLI
uniref:Ig-like domain-containing protein n=1 Tax=Poecilia latipinna TaxID=48699 RepID=A0A3B3VAQ1_9TELE